MKSQIERGLFCLLCIFLLFGCKNSNSKQDIIATVEDEKLSLSELMEDIPEHIRYNLTNVEIRELVLRWINNEVLYHEALERELDKRPEPQKEFNKLKKELLINRLLELTLDKDLAVSKEEIKQFYDNNREAFILDEDMVHAYHILVDTKKEARTVRKRIRGGESFDVLIKEIKQDTLANDWDLGYFSKSEVIPEISKVVFSLSEGATSLPIKSDFGYHVVKLIDKQKKGEVKNFETVKEEIRLKLQTKKKQERYQRFLLQMKSKFKIDTNFKLLDSAMMDSLLNKGV